MRTGQLTRVRADLRAFPGSPSEVIRIIGELEANIVEVHHQRAFTHFPVQSAEVAFVARTRGVRHRDALFKAFKAAGFNPESVL